MIKFLFISFIIYLIFRFIRGLFNGIFFFSQIQNPQGENQESRQNPFIYRSSSREKDISDRARILDEDKNDGEKAKLSDS